jgi:hypothetical protein
MGADMIVVSDMMGTLTTGSPFLGLVDWVKHNQSRLRANYYLAVITPSYLLAKNGLIDWQSWGQNLMVKSLSYIRNADEEKVRHASEWVVEHNLWKKRREDVVARLVRHREEGCAGVHRQQCGGTVHRAFCKAHRRAGDRHVDGDRGRKAADDPANWRQKRKRSSRC